jgi:hypothetical protein
MTWSESCDYCAEHVKPCLKTMTELTQYLEEYYGAIEVEGTDDEKGELKNNVVIQKFEHLLSSVKPLETESTQMEREELVEIMKKRTEEMNQITAEELGLQMKFYQLPKNEHTAGFFADWAQQYGFSEAELEGCRLPLQVELTTGYLSCLPGRFQDEMILFLGLDERDLKNRTGRFYQYVMAYQNQEAQKNFSD